MKTSQIELIATPQFDSGRWKLRLERAPISAIEQSNNTQPWIPQPSQRLLPSVGQLLAASMRCAPVAKHAGLNCRNSN
jgi:hypothetical protein